ncbi:CoA pyrophosphatase [Pilimelia columellifera]|uniref:CoA pyrophosphatase n=1 Tax=Pilimelia columellifera subsp. columellifera TaxID=706583 RepID=A0ABN3NC66_9ACTN
MTAELPAWWEPLLSRARAARTRDFTQLRRPEPGGRPGAVLVLIGDDGDTGPDVLVIQRPDTMRTHAGQPAFPGGAAEAGDAGPTDTALREAAEEVGLVPASAVVVAQLPPLWIPVSDFTVTPVLAWWRAPHEVGPRQPREVARVARLPVTELVDPENRLRVRMPNGWTGPAFDVGGMRVWGFTAGILATVLDFAGWSRPWPTDRIVDLAPSVTTSGPRVVVDGVAPPVL